MPLARSRGNRYSRRVATHASDPFLQWTPSTLYRSLLHVFGEAVPGVPFGRRFRVYDKRSRKKRIVTRAVARTRERVRPVIPPFCPALDAKELGAALSEYRAARASNFLERLRSRERGAQKWPDWNAQECPAWQSWLANPKPGNEIDIAIGRFLFADNRDQDSRARKELRRLARSGPVQERPARSQLFQALMREKPAPHQVVAPSMGFEFFTYLAEREFIWTLLRAEAKATQRLGIREDRAHARVAAAYSYVARNRRLPYRDLTSDRIIAGLRTERPWATDVATRFKVKAESVPVIVNRLVGRNPDGMR